MILTGKQIEKSVHNGEINITHFNPKNLNPNSYNYRLSPTLLEIQDQIIDPAVKPITKKIIIPPSGVILEPKKLYLGSTYEKIGSDMYVPSLIGKSSLGRLGLFLQITSDLGNLGVEMNWTLELKVVQRLRVYPMMIVGQVSFWKTYGICQEFYTTDDKYFGDTCPQSSKFYQELSFTL